MRTEFTEEADGVFAFQLYEPEHCRSIVSHLKSLDDWEPGQVVVPDVDGSPVDVTMPEARTATILHWADGEALYREFGEKLDDVVKPLIKELWHADLTGDTGRQVIRYEQGGHYGAHIDAGPLVSERYFTVLCYLNDDFAGGRTLFPSLGYSTTPRSGKAILFPAAYFHGAEPVTAGEKYVMLAWITGPRPIKWI
jgi:predicted 2-oxoglutarate/Fe(II)-dependent dioxygenase YbiX